MYLDCADYSIPPVIKILGLVRKSYTQPPGGCAHKRGPPPTLSLFSGLLYTLYCTQVGKKTNYSRAGPSILEERLRFSGQRVPVGPSGSGGRWTKRSLLVSTGQSPETDDLSRSSGVRRLEKVAFRWKPSGLEESSRDLKSHHLKKLSCFGGLVRQSKRG